MTEQRGQMGQTSHINQTDYRFKEYNDKIENLQLCSLD